MATVLLGCNAELPYEISEGEAARYAELRCRAAAACCESVGTDCEASWRDTVLGWQEQADGRLVFSQECMTEALSWMETLSCDDEVHLDAPICRLAHGDQLHGESCVELGDLGVYGSACAEDLQCLDGRCVDDPLFIADAPPGGFCDSIEWTCGDGYFCAAQGTCEPGIEAGGSCDKAAACLAVDGNAYYCAGLATDGVGTCSPRPLLGEACIDADEPCGFACDESSSCSQLGCIDGVCSFLSLPPAVCEG